MFRFLILSQFEYPCQMLYLWEWRWFGNFIVQQYYNKNSFVLAIDRFFLEMGSYFFKQDLRII